MKGKVEMEKAALGGLGPVFDVNDEDKRCVFLVDSTGNAYTFFKYKAKLIDLVSELMAVSIGKKEKADAMQDIRKGLTYGIKNGQVVVLHLGQNAMDFEAFLKDQKFWNPKQLFRPFKEIDAEWYRANVMKPTDKDPFGNQGTLYPSDNGRFIISLSKEVAFEEIKWLDGLEANFKGMFIS